MERNREAGNLGRLEEREFRKEIRFYLDIFSALRTYIEHEDGLIQSRTSWFINLNALLFTSLAILLSAISTISVLSLSFAVLLSIVGGMVSLTTHSSVVAANDSMRQVRRLWRDTYEPNVQEVLLQRKTYVFKKGEERPIGFKHSQYLPFLTGGGPGEKITARGRMSSLWLPRIIGLIWVVILVTSCVLIFSDQEKVDSLLSEVRTSVDSETELELRNLPDGQPNLRNLRK